jgi:hypothetical protein
MKNLSRSLALGATAFATGQVGREGQDAQFSVGLNLGDMFQLTGSFEILRPPLGGTDVAWYFGGKAGSYAGVLATVALVAVGAVVAATWTW